MLMLHMENVAQWNLCWSTGWKDTIVALEKTTWFHFRLMKTGFIYLFIYLFFFCCRPSTSWPVVYKSQEP